MTNEQNEVDIGSTLKLSIDIWERFDNHAYFEFTEHACDHYSSDTETSVDVDKEKAIEIIAALKKAFNL